MIIEPITTSVRGNPCISAYAKAYTVSDRTSDALWLIAICSSSYMGGRHIAAHAETARFTQLFRDFETRELRSTSACPLQRTSCTYYTVQYKY